MPAGYDKFPGETKRVNIPVENHSTCEETGEDPSALFTNEEGVQQTAVQ